MTDQRQKLHGLSGGHPKDERHAWYVVSAPNLDPAWVTRLTGISADRSWRVGEPKPYRRARTTQQNAGWLLDSGLGVHDEFHDHLDALLARMRPAWEAFVELGRRYEAMVEVAVYCYEAQGPLVQLLPDVAAALSEINTPLGFDLYALVETKVTEERSEVPKQP